VDNRNVPKWMKKRLLGVFDELVAALIIAALSYVAWLVQGVLPNLVSNPRILVIVAMAVAVVLTVVSVAVWLKRRLLAHTLVVAEDNAAIIERKERFSRIVYARKTILWPSERVRTTVDLRPQKAVLVEKNILIVQRWFQVTPSFRRVRWRCDK